jgi:AAA family ATPase
MPHVLSDHEISVISENTHGYVGADLSQLCKQAALNSLKRQVQISLFLDNTREMESSENINWSEMTVNFKDFQEAMTEIRPSAMREIFAEIPTVRWSDIGGYENVKQQLRESVEWPIKHPEKFTKFGIKPPRGVLLYGPPGCSKTLVAKALATEAGLNFIPVKVRCWWEDGARRRYNAKRREEVAWLEGGWRGKQER